MAGIKELKGRIDSVKETKKITSAMYLIASTKLRKARSELDYAKPGERVFIDVGGGS